MIKIAIVEDEAMYAKQLEEFLHQYEKENGEAFDITIYSDGDQIVNKYQSQYDIILMDVEMKFMDGMHVIYPAGQKEIPKMADSRYYGGCASDTECVFGRNG